MSDVGCRKTEFTNTKYSAMRINSAKDLDVYKKGYEVAMNVFGIEQKVSA